MEGTELLRAYDEHLRTAVEMRGAKSVERHGPLWLAAFAGGRGFVTYRDLDNLDAVETERLVAGVRDRFEADSSIQNAEWKTRAHDHASGLHDALVAHGFVPQEPESIMLGDSVSLPGTLLFPLVSCFVRCAMSGTCVR